MHKKLLLLSPAEFENLIFDLVQLLGLNNCVWRTPGADGGRDIQGEFFSPDFSGFRSIQKWYIECKRYKDTVDWPTIWEKIAYAESNDASLLLLVTTANLSPTAKSEIEKWNSRRKNLIIRFWDIHALEKNLSLFPQICIKYGLAENPEERLAISILPLTKFLVKYIQTSQGFKDFFQAYRHPVIK